MTDDKSYDRVSVLERLRTRVSVLERHMTDVLERLRALEQNSNEVDDHIAALEKRQQQHDLEVKAKAALTPQSPTLAGWYGPETLPARDPDNADYSVTVFGVWFSENNLVRQLDTAFYSYRSGFWAIRRPPDAWCYIPTSQPQTEPGEHKALPEGAHTQ